MKTSSISPINGGECTYRILRKSGDRVRGLPHHKERRRVLREKSTEAEKTLWELLRGKRLYGKKFRRQHRIGPYIADFYCDELKLIVEVDGSVHDSKEARGYDKERDQYFMSLDYSVLHLSNREVIDTPSIAIKKIEGMFSVYPPPFMGEMEGVRI